MPWRIRWVRYVWGTAWCGSPWRSSSRAAQVDHRDWQTSARSCWAVCAGQFWASLVTVYAQPYLAHSCCPQLQWSTMPIVRNIIGNILIKLFWNKNNIILIVLSDRTPLYSIMRYFPIFIYKNPVMKNNYFSLGERTLKIKWILSALSPSCLLL